MTYNDDNDPTGYYRRKHKRNMEYTDKALIPFFKWAFVVLAVFGVVELVRDCTEPTPCAPPCVLPTG